MSFWQSSEIRWAASGMVGAIVSLVHGIKTKDWGLVITSVGTLTSLAYWVKDRIRRGKDPSNPAPPVRLTKQ